MIPRVIDELPVLAIAATQATGRTIIRDAEELRVKESDRIKATVENLKRMGAKVEELSDGMSIDGPQQLRGTEIESFGDHRIAMAFAVAGLAARGQSLIKNAECAEISFPGFFEMLERLRSD
jgi:3-phosphoshikimate 1-carboxyvinyltransferase